MLAEFAVLRSFRNRREESLLLASWSKRY